MDGNITLLFHSRQETVCSEAVHSNVAKKACNLIVNKLVKVDKCYGNIRMNTGSFGADKRICASSSQRNIYSQFNRSFSSLVDSINSNEFHLIKSC